MHCYETNHELEVVRFQNIDVETLRKLDEHFDKTTLENLIEHFDKFTLQDMLDILIILKSKVFGGNGRGWYQLNGGNMTKQGIEAIVQSGDGERKKPPRTKKFA